MPTPPRHRTPSILPLLLSLLPLSLVLLPTLTSSGVIPYTTIGPDIVSPGGIALLTYAYPLFHQAYNASLPTLHLGITLSDSALPMAYSVEALQFVVDLTNFRGGVSYRGQAYNLAITYADDDGSSELVRIIYSDMFASGLYAMYFAPFGDALLQALQPVLNASQAQATLFAMENTDPSDYTQHYPNLFSMFATADETWNPPLAVVNSAAVAYHAQTGLGSPHGISTLCLYTADETLLTAAAQGVRDWVTGENARRGGVDTVRVLVDVMWSMNVSATYLDYVQPLLQCPDGVDVMVLMADSTSGLAVTSALQASQRRPKAVMGLDVVSQITITQESVVPEAAGWTVALPVSTASSTLGPQGGVFYSIFDAAEALYLWKNGSGSTLQPIYASYQYLYPAGLQIMAAAIARSASLSAADLRAAFLSLSGESGLLGSLDFSNLTGTNQARASLVSQVNRTGALVFDVYSNATLIEYPYDWPWHPLQYGDDVPSSLNQATILIAVVIAVLGAWVASIIVEQSVFVRRKGGRWWLWLMVVAASLGGVGQWCAMLMMASGVSITPPVLPVSASASEFAMLFSLPGAFVSLVPCLLLTWLGLVVLITDVESQSMRGQSRTSQTQMLLREQKEAKKKRAALSWREHVIHLYQAMSWRVLLGGMLIAVGLPLTRLPLTQQIWLVSAEPHLARWSWAVTVLLDVLVVPLCMLVYFHGLRWRVSAVFLFAAIVMQDWLVGYASLQWTYEAVGRGVPSVFLHGQVSQEAVQLLAGIIAACICLAFISLQFSRMQLSRNGLSVLVASLEQTTAQQKADIARATTRSTTLRTQLDSVCRMLDFISLNSHLPTEYAFVLAFSSTFSTFQSAWASSASNASQPTGGATKGSLVRRPTAEHKPRPQMSHNSSAVEVSEMVGQRVSRLRRHGSASVAPAPESDGGGSGQPKLSRQPSDMPTEMFSLSPSAHVPRLGEGEEGAGGGADEAVVQAGAGRVKPASLVLNDNHTLVLHSSQVASPRMSATDADAPMHVMSPTTSTTGLKKKPAGGKEWKVYDEELLTALELQMQWKEEQQGQNQGMPSSPTTKRSLTRASLGHSPITGDDPDTSFDLTMPVLPRQALQADAAQLSAQPNPSLLTLLSHPVCLELVKTELERIHSVENLIFFLHVQRYRFLTRPSTRKALALCIYEQFVKPGAPQEINLATRQRELVAAGVLKKGEDGCHVELFREAEKEVLMLMETNVMKSMQGTAMQRLCTWILAIMPVRQITEGTGEGAGEGDEWGLRASQKADPQSSKDSGGRDGSRLTPAIDSPAPPRV